MDEKRDETTAGAPAQGVPAQGVPAQGVPAQGVPAQGAPAQGEIAPGGIAPGASEVPVATPDQLKALDAARSLLLHVHRALLEVERKRYEKVRGRIENNSAFLQLVIADPWFDWLRPMAQLVLLIDERTSDKENRLGSTEANALLDRARGLLRADAEGDAFQRLYYQAVQSSPELAVIARQVAGGITK